MEERMFNAKVKAKLERIEEVLVKISGTLECISKTLEGKL